MIVLAAMAAILYVEIKVLLSGEGNILLSIETQAKSVKIGEVVINTDSIIPFISVVYNGEDIFTDGTKSGQCKDQKGDCLKFVSQYLKIKWQTVKKDDNVIDSHSGVCADPEISNLGGHLFLCPAVGM